MSEKSTTELLNILNEIKPEQMDSFIKEYSKDNQNISIFSQYMAEHNINTSSIVKNCNGLISQSYVYDILNGTKTNPSRDIVLILCVAAGMNRKSTRRILEVYGHRELYAKDTRDIIIATYINNKKFNLNEINDELFRYGLQTLNSQ